MSQRSFRIGLGIVVTTILLLFGCGAYFYRVASHYPITSRDGNGDNVRVVIDTGMSFPSIARRLAEAKIIERPDWFRYYGMYRGDTTKVRPGEYVLPNNATPQFVLDRLLVGVPEVSKKVTIPEGLHMLEVFALIEKAGIANATELELLGRDPLFLEKRGIEGDTVEGYLFPDTYNFQAPSKPVRVLDTMIKQHRIVWDRLRRDYEKKMSSVRKKHGWSDHQFLIMASIAEKEAANTEELPRIAQVFMNRLLSPQFVPHRLDTDPTIRYGCTVPLQKSAACQEWDSTDRLHRKQLNDADNPYNTYQHEGLPPGPICNPGAAALTSVMDPDQSQFFFFVATGEDNRHAFAKTRIEHERNVDKYIRNKK